MQGESPFPVLVGLSGKTVFAAGPNQASDDANNTPHTGVLCWEHTSAFLCERYGGAPWVKSHVYNFSVHAS